MVDKVGLETVYYAMIDLGADCDIDVREGEYVGPSECIGWDEGTSDTIGECHDNCGG